MELPNEAQRRISQDKVAWLTTITDRGGPAPNPVWFVPDGDDLVGDYKHNLKFLQELFNA